MGPDHWYGTSGQITASVACQQWFPCALRHRARCIVVGFWNTRTTCAMSEPAVRREIKSRGSTSTVFDITCVWGQAVGEGRSNSTRRSCSPADCWERDPAEDVNVHFVWASLAGKKRLLHFWSSIWYSELPKKHNYQGKFSSCFILSKHIHTCCLGTPWLINVLCAWDSLIRLTIEIAFSNAGSNLYQKCP